jgi:hypothetical protein
MVRHYRYRSYAARANLAEMSAQHPHQRFDCCRSVTARTPAKRRVRGGHDVDSSSIPAVASTPGGAMRVLVVAHRSFGSRC